MGIFCLPGLSIAGLGSLPVPPDDRITQEGVRTVPGLFVSGFCDPGPDPPREKGFCGASAEYWCVAGRSALDNPRKRELDGGLVRCLSVTMLLP
jgi:hypothetical protein